MSKNKDQNSKIDSKIGSKISLLREREALTVEELAVKLGFTTKQLFNYENGIVPLPVLTLLHIANFFNETLSYFYQGLLVNEAEENKKAIRNFYKKIGLKVCLLRKSKGITQADLAKKLGIGESSVKNYENGNFNISVTTLLKIAQALEISPEYFYQDFINQSDNQQAKEIMELICNLLDESDNQQAKEIMELVYNLLDHGEISDDIELKDANQQAKERMESICNSLDESDNQQAKEIMELICNLLDRSEISDDIELKDANQQAKEIMELILNLLDELELSHIDR